MKVAKWSLVLPKLVAGVRFPTLAFLFPCDGRKCIDGPQSRGLFYCPIDQKLAGYCICGTTGLGLKQVSDHRYNDPLKKHAGSLELLFDRLIPAFEYVDSGRPTARQRGKAAVIVIASTAPFPNCWNLTFRRTLYINLS